MTISATYHVDRAVDSVELGDGRRLFTAMSEERVLAACPDVLDCTVVTVRDGDRVVTDVLLLLTEDADQAVNRSADLAVEQAVDHAAEQAVDHAADRAADRTKAVVAALDEAAAATVRRVLVVSPEDLPLGPTGKVRKVLLRQRHLAAVQA
ncbi:MULTISPECIES: hypothetical protein [unclassified Kitasatospora]|uniref:hypothetical protein n=1 Tax=unclassified Kitasatospora TaxID=2633591 RepID=UPI0033D62A6F